MSRYFTAKGDDGTTGMLGEGRVSKADLRMEVLGVLDEVSAALGLARAACKSDQVDKTIRQLQRDLYGMMAEIAATPENVERFRSIDGTKVAWLEEQTEKYGSNVTMPSDFILPGDSLGEAALALARTIIRRAERRAVDLFSQYGIENIDILRYLNRASSLLFVLEIFELNRHQRQRITLAKQEKEEGDGRDFA